MPDKMLSLFDYLGRAAGPELGLIVAAYARHKNSKVEIRQVSNRKYTGPINLYTESLLDSFFNNPDYAEDIKKDKQWYDKKYKSIYRPTWLFKLYRKKH